MKRLVAILLCAVSLSTIFAYADDLTSSQLKLRNEIKAFLQEEGFMPEIDSDGDIKFKKEGSTYYISVNSNDTSPMYVSLSLGFNKPEGYSDDAIKIAANELNLYKGVKVICLDRSFSIRGEMYLVSSEAFKYSFYKLMSQISNVEDDFMDELKKVSYSGGGSSSLIPFVITKLEVANTDENGEIIQDYGSTIYDFKTKYLKPRITVQSLGGKGDYTVYIKLYKDGGLRTGSSSPAGYSYDDEITVSGTSSQVITLPGWGSSTAGHWSAGNYRFEIWYGDYCIGSKSFKVI